MEKSLTVKKNIYKSKFSNVDLVEIGGKEFILKEWLPSYGVKAEDLKNSYEIYKTLQDKIDLVPIYDLWEENNKVYILMEYLADYTPLINEKQNKHITFVKVFDILEKLYRQGIVNGDASIENFMINPAGIIKMIDYLNFVKIENLNSIHIGWMGECFLRFIKWYCDDTKWSKNDRTRDELLNRLRYFRTIRHRYSIDSNKKLIPTESQNCKLGFMNQKFMNAMGGKRFLDIGCSAGFYVLKAKQAGASKAIGIDLEYSDIRLATDVSKFLNLDVEFLCEQFSEKLLRFPKFDIVTVCSLYHHIFMMVKSHGKIFNILSLLTKNLFIELPLDITDPTTKELAESSKWFAKEYTKEKILKAAKEYFNLEYLGEYLIPQRKFYWMTVK